MTTLALARSSDPDTSAAAATRVDVTRLESIVLAALAVAGERGMTSHELAEATGLSLVTVSPRLRPLCNKRLVNATLVRREGRIVWRIAPLPSGDAA